MTYNTDTIDSKTTMPAVQDVLLTKLYDAEGPIHVGDFLRGLGGAEKRVALQTIDVLLNKGAIEQTKPSIVGRALSCVGLARQSMTDVYLFVGKESRFFYHQLIRNPQTDQG